MKFKGSCDIIFVLCLCCGMLDTQCVHAADRQASMLVQSLLAARGAGNSVCWQICHQEAQHLCQRKRKQSGGSQWDRGLLQQQMTTTPGPPLGSMSLTDDERRLSYFRKLICLWHAALDRMSGPGRSFEPNQTCPSRGNHCRSDETL